MHKLVISLGFVFCISAFSLPARKERPEAPSAAVLDSLSRYNHSARADRPSDRVERPYAEYEEARYFLMSGYSLYNTEEAKKTLLRDLPKNVTAIVLVNDKEALEEAKENWGRLLSADRLKFLISADSDESGAFWARDSLPVPVFQRLGAELKLGLVDARNWFGFEPDEQLGKHLGAEVLSHPYYYEGGNFEADTKGNCFVVNNPRVEEMPDSVFERYYGCRSLTRFPYLAGIGHVDEVLRLLSDRVAYTTHQEYRSALEAKGFEVKLLPKHDNYRTYANSLLVNGTLFLPVFSEATDATAIRMYEEAGLHVIPIDSRTLSDDGHGSIHCATMTYPLGTFVQDERDSALVHFR